MALSVVIPSYRNPAYLDLCLKSAIDHQVHSDNQIIVVLDGFGSESYEVLQKYPTVEICEFPENRGALVAHNVGVTLAENEYVLIVNDDNVFPYKWDAQLTPYCKQNFVMAPQQIEPVSSIFKTFTIHDYGRTPDTFDYDAYTAFTKSQYETVRSASLSMDWEGGRWPVLMEKKNYMMLGGVDVTYPNAAVADWDFFFRCQLAGLELWSIPHTYFYHFGSATISRSDVALMHKAGERESFEYFRWKWGFYPVLEPLTNKKIPHNSECPRGFSL